MAYPSSVKSALAAHFQPMDEGWGRGAGGTIIVRNLYLISHPVTHNPQGCNLPADRRGCDEQPLRAVGKVHPWGLWVTSLP